VEWLKQYSTCLASIRPFVETPIQPKKLDQTKKQIKTKTKTPVPPKRQRKSKFNEIDRFNNNWLKKIYHANANQEKAGMVILIHINIR
jgi:hypothetical protein